MRNGTISALLDPDRDKLNSPVFAIRTKSGVTEATGTFYAVTEYKGQAYAAVKKGKVKKETIPPTKPDFSAYLKSLHFLLLSKVHLRKSNMVMQLRRHKFHPNHWFSTKIWVIIGQFLFGYNLKCSI